MAKMSAAAVSRGSFLSWKCAGSLARHCSASAIPTARTSTDLQPPTSALSSVDKYRAFKASIYRGNRSDSEFERVARKNECR